MKSEHHVTFLPEALIEADEIADFYEAQSPRLGRRFSRTVVDTVTIIQQRPTSFPVFHSRFRRAIVGVFPVGVIYYISSTEIVVAAIIDLRRDPDGIRRTLRNR